ncbi:hypothetical protein QQ045_002652 [Rhodiola kirilowii]
MTDQRTMRLQRQRRLTMFTVITSSITKKGELYLADVTTQLKNKNITSDFKVDTNSNVIIPPI